MGLVLRATLQGMKGFFNQKNVEHHQNYPVINSQSQKDSYKEVPQTPLVSGRVVHCARFSKKAALSPLVNPSQTVCFSCSGGLSFSSTITGFSPLPKADSRDGAAAVEVVETEVGAEVVDLGWLEGWRPRLLHGGCC